MILAFSLSTEGKNKDTIVYYKLAIQYNEKNSQAYIGLGQNEHINKINKNIENNLIEI